MLCQTFGIPSCCRRAFELLPRSSALFSVGKYSSTRMVEIVEMMIVAQKYVIERAEIICIDSWTGKFQKRHRPGRVRATTDIKGGICQQPNAPELKESGWATNVSNPKWIFRPYCS